MTPEAQKAIIDDYINAYNRFDVDAMTAHLHPDIVFQNISGSEITLETKGLAAFTRQAQEAVTYFRERRQVITKFHSDANTMDVSIVYYGRLAVALPNGLQPGDVLELNGRSIFVFQDEKIIGLTDIS